MLNKQVTPTTTKRIAQNFSVVLNEKGTYLRISSNCSYCLNEDETFENNLLAGLAFTHNNIL